MGVLLKAAYFEYSITDVTNVTNVKYVNCCLMTVVNFVEIHRLVYFLRFKVDLVIHLGCSRTDHLTEV